MPIDNVFAAVSVSDIDAAKLWSERLLGRPADNIPMPVAAEWQITDAGWLQLVLDADRAGKSMLTLGVDDLAGHIAELTGRGVSVGEMTSGDVARFVIVADPEGNQITIAELIES